jgi:hypothetical protein
VVFEGTSGGEGCADEWVKHRRTPRGGRAKRGSNRRAFKKQKKTRGESGRVFIHTSDFSLWGIDRRRQFGRVMRCDLRPSLSKLSLGRATTQNPEYVVATRVTRVLGGRRRRPDGDHATSVEVSLAKRRTWEARPRAPRRHSRLIQAQTSEASRSTIQAHNASKIKNKKFSAVLFRYFPRSFAGMDPPTA